MDVADLASWFGLALRVLGLLIVAGVVVVLGRRGAPATTWALVAAAGVEAVVLVASRLLWLGVRWLPYELMETSFVALALLDVVQTVLLGALGVLVVGMMGRDARRPA